MQSNAITKDLINQISNLHKDLQSIDIIVSFIRMSGFKEIEQMLVYARQKGIPVRILTSTYMNVTEPVALSVSGKIKVVQKGPEKLCTHSGSI